MNGSGLVGKNPISSFSRGIASPYLAGRFILGHKKLIKYIFIPFVINLVVFCIAVYFGLGLFDKIVTHYIPQENAWFWSLLGYFLWGVAVVLTAILVFFSFAVVGNLIASPFNDILSERTEEILTGQCDDEPFKLKAFIQDARRTFIDEGKKILFFVFGMVLLLLLNLIPVFGSLLYPVLSFLLTTFFLAVEYTGYIFSRKRLTYKDQRRFIFSRPALFFGFGTGLLCLLAIPFLQFLCIPLGVVGAMQLYAELNGTN